MKKEKRLKNLYIRIHKRYPLTLNDLLFLADYDMECFVKTYRNLILDAPVRRIFHKNIEITQAPITVDEDYRKRIASLISEMHSNKVNSDVVVGIKPEAVMALIEEYAEAASPQSRKYQYYSLVEPASLLNIQA